MTAGIRLLLYAQPLGGSAISGQGRSAQIISATPAAAMAAVISPMSIAEDNCLNTICPGDQTNLPQRSC